MPMASAKAVCEPKKSMASFVSMPPVYRYPDIRVNRHADINPRHHIFMGTFGKRIKKARNFRKLSQINLAKLVGIKQPTLSEIETGETKMLEGETLVSLAMALKVRPEWIMTGLPPSGLELKSTKSDQLLKQLIDLYHELSDDDRHGLVEFANFKFAQNHPDASVANPFPRAVGRGNFDEILKV